ncbi:MAG: lysylphosphatidylglycerol synthase domain-containing protein [Ramlibacter sp.]|nr:lysylphosphatidylglycerol synthase domain-containing protein [Ramlibacter sp.]
MNTGALQPGERIAPARREETPPAAKPGLTDRPWWKWVKRLFTLAFFTVVALLLYRYGRNVDWEDVLASVKETPRPALMTAIALAAASHLLYSCFDLLGRHYTGHGLRTPIVMLVNFISYAFNLTLGSMVGGVAFRYRLYSRLGLDNGVITRVVTMSMLTNWLGYMLLGGLLFLFHPMALPPSWKMGNHGLQWIGALLVAVSVGYLIACLRAGGKRWEVRGHEINLPHFRVAVLQLAMSCLNWSLMGGIVYMLLQQQVAYSDVLTVLLVAAIAGVVAHVPAGLGVFEFIFVALLSHQISEGRLLAALLGYRGIYYIGPAAIAAVMVLVFEVRAKRGTLARATVAKTAG